MGWGAGGVVLAQVDLLAVYLVFGLGAFWQRLAFHWTVMSLVWITWLCGYYWLLDFGSSGKPIQAIMALFLELPLFALALQSPLWIARGFGLRLQHPSDVSPAKPWSIADLLFGTTVAAVSLGAALIDRDSYGTSPVTVIRPVAVGLLFGGIVALPLSWAVLRVRSVRLAAGATLAYGLLLVSGSVLFVLVTGGAANIGVWIVVALGLAEVSCLAVTAICLAIARLYGWRLTTDREVLSTRSAVAEPPAA